MDKEDMLALATEFMAAVQAGDPDRLARVYAEDVVIWHTFDRAEQGAAQNIRTLLWMHKHVRGLRYEDVAVAATEDGFVQQHVLRADHPPLDVPCMLRAWCRNSRIIRLEEYLDSAHSRPLTEYILQVRQQRAES